jgi:hypothetical protein
VEIMLGAFLRVLLHVYIVISKLARWRCYVTDFTDPGTGVPLYLQFLLPVVHCNPKKLEY